MSNTIYNKLRTKRKYVRKPKCENKLGMCEFKKCRCEPLKIPKRKKPTEREVEELLHRQKVIEVKRREFLQAIDNEIEDMDNRWEANPEFKGDYGRSFKPQKTLWQKIVEFCSQILP